MADAELIIQTPDGGTRPIRLVKERYRIGRASSTDLPFTELRDLSREHLMIERSGVHWAVSDLGSMNGTFVNGKRLTASVMLQPKDRITAAN
jgi:pSer/pThr/pTyr-binding forkhead associated (FHA) protein